MEIEVECGKCRGRRTTFNDVRGRADAMIECKNRCFETHSRWTFIREVDRGTKDGEVKEPPPPPPPLPPPPSPSPSRPTATKVDEEKPQPSVATDRPAAGALQHTNSCPCIVS